MPIDTDNEELSVIHLVMPWEPNVIMTPGTIDVDDQQQLLWGFPEIIWSTHVQAANLEDLNTLFIPYVATLHNNTLTQPDSDTLVANDLSAVRAATPEYDEDLNTAYAVYLS